MNEGISKIIWAFWRGDEKNIQKNWNYYNGCDF